MAAILAGGESSRFHADKAMADLGGAPMIVRVGERLRAQSEDIAVVGHERGAAVLGCRWLVDPETTTRGPLLGVLAGLLWAASEDAEWLITAPCDTPFIPLTFAERLMQAAREARAPAAFAQTQSGAHPLCAVWSPKLVAVFRDHFEAGVHPQVRAAAQGAQAVMFEDEAAFANINTQAELDRARLCFQG